MEALSGANDRASYAPVRWVDQAALPCAVFDLARRFVAVNRAYEELIGYTSAELFELSAADITPPRWVGAGEDALTQLLETGKAASYEKEYRRKDGSLVSVEIAVDALRDDAGKPTAYLAFVTDVTRRKRAEQAMQQSEERFRLLYHEAPFGYHEIDVEGTIVSINRTECDMLGYSRDEMLGRPVFDFVAPEQRESARTAVREKMSGKRPLRSLERPYITRDGTRLVMAIEERYRFDESGRIIGIRSTLQDITERKRTEAALVASERRNRALFEGIEDAVFVHDFEGQILDANPAACRRLGYSRDELLALNTAEIDAPEFAQGYEERLRMQLERGHASFEGRHRTKDGKVFPVDINTSTIVIENRRAVLAVIRDITDRKALEEARRQAEDDRSAHARQIEEVNRELTRSEARYRKLADGSLDAIVAVGQDGRVTLFNPAAERTFGHDAAEVLGQPIDRLIPGGLERKDVGLSIDRSGVRKGGESFPIEVSLGELDVDGEMQFIVSVRDQTERQRMRAMLVQSERLASIGLLSAGVAHEINNPLAYVGNNLAVLDRDLKGVRAMIAEYESARDALAVATPETLARIDALSADLDWPYVRDNLDRMLARTREGVQRMASIVQNLRGLARTSPPKLETALLRDLIGPPVEMVLARARRGRIEIQAGAIPTVRFPCVASQISQVVLNLLVNAVQAVESAGRPEGGLVTIAASERPGEVSIAIGDNGCGIEAENIPKLFDPFFTTKVVGEGTGLGLSISHGIVVGHGGRIDVDSRPGAGSTFTIVLPARSTAAPRGRIETETETEPETETR